MNEADTLLAELEAIVAPGAADTRLVATNSKLREEGAEYNLRIAELELKLRNAEASRLEAQRAEAAALSRSAYFEAKLAERERVIAGMSKAYRNLGSKVGPLREQSRDDAIRAASATARAVDAERQLDLATKAVAEFKARAERAEPLAARVEAAEKKAAEAVAAERNAYLVSHDRNIKALQEIVDAASRSSPAYAIAEAKKELKKAKKVR